MKSIVRRIEALEKRLMPAPETASTRELLVRIEQGRERVRKMREKDGLPPHENWVPKKIHTSQGIRRLMDMINEGRDLVRIEHDKRLRQSSPPATGVD